MKIYKNDKNEPQSDITNETADNQIKAIFIFFSERLGYGISYKIQYLGSFWVKEN